MDKMIITCAVTGAETTKKDNPNLPVKPEEIADAAYEAFLAGASIIHLHVRDNQGNPVQDIEIFKKTMDLIRRKCDIVIEVTTGGAVGMSAEERLQPLKLQPEMASLDCGTINFGDEYIVNTLPLIREFASEMKRNKVRPVLECFDLSHIDTSLLLIKEKLVEPPFYYGFVMNVPGGVRYDQETLNFFTKRIPDGSLWTVIGIGGKASFESIFGAISAGGFIRQGFEDNIYYSRGILAESNAQLVERAAAIAKSAGKQIASPSDVRKLLNLGGSSKI